MAQVIKSVSLNDKNDKDKKIMKHVARRNFSGYVKRLILEDIEKKESEKELKKASNKKYSPVKKTVSREVTEKIQQPKLFLPNQK